MDRIFLWHITGSLGFGIRGAVLSAQVALFNSIGLVIYAFAITIGVLLAFRVMS